MKIAVQNGLDKLAEELRRCGFEVVMCSECTTPIDAFVYIGESMPTAKIVSSTADERYGVFMINARGKSASEIALMLNRRTYTPLF